MAFPVIDLEISSVNVNFARRALSLLVRASDRGMKSLLFHNLRLAHRLKEFSSAPFPLVDEVQLRETQGRGTNSYRKLDALLAHMPSDARQIVDIGSNNGFFSINLAQRDYSVLGYEPHGRFVHGCNQISERFNVSNVAFIQQGLDEASSRRIFQSDVTLVLSVFHNWVKQEKFETAIQILINVWAKTRMAMFFELADTCDNQVIAGFETMPQMGTTTAECRLFIEREILKRLPGAQIEFLQMMPTDFINGSERHLFILHREQSGVGD